MKRKIENICWILFSIGSMACLFYNFVNRPPVGDKTALIIYIIGAAGTALIYPAIMLFLAFRNRSLYEKLQKKSEVRAHKKQSVKSSGNFPQGYKYTGSSEVRRLISALGEDEQLTTEEKEFLLEYIKKK